MEKITKEVRAKFEKMKEKSKIEEEEKKKKEREKMNEDLNCMFCIHRSVCKHWDKWSDHFPYKNDDLIKRYLKGISTALANACAYYNKEKEK